MMPTRRPQTTASRLALAALATCLALAGCIPAPEQTPAPAPAPLPPAAPAPAPSPVVQAAPTSAGHWLDAPVTPGDWSYANGIARFGEPNSEARLTLRCDRAAGIVEIVRSGPAAAALPMIVRTEAQERSIDAVPVPGEMPSIVARVPARDPLLDAMAFSKGRFAVEIGGLPNLYVPSWPEVTRVIEDCR